ncbi:hypothetical protein G6F24_015714 [Rhizopus arrhizus]|nr:hypothetical protein G6F24_015714 [Rhizopus arrhizus]
MPDASVASLFRNMAQGVHEYLAESLRICSVYLGIAVIVTVSMGFALPGLRDQALQVHKALLTALAPSSMQSGTESDVGSELGSDTASAIAMAVPTAPASNATGMLGPARVAPPVPKKPATVATGPQAEALRNYISRKSAAKSSLTPCWSWP